MRKFLLFFFSFFLCSEMAAAASDSAVVLMYHRFNEPDFPSKNVTIEQLESHIKEIQENGYTVLPLGELVDRFEETQAFDPKTIAITIDDGFETIFTEAYPRFKKAGFPFTIFMSTNAIDGAYNGYMNWKQVKELAEDPLVTFGAHTASHLHMAKSDPAKLGDEMTRSLDRFENQLGIRPDLFAYPFGEASLEVIDVVRGFGMRAAFGQHSGAIGHGDDAFFLPRFALNENYGSLKRFQMVSKTQSLFVKDLGPKDMKVGARNPPIIGFTVDEKVGSLDPLACFASHQGKLRLERVWDRRIEVRIDEPMPKGRTRLNCTMPAGDGTWRWFGRMFYVAP